MTGPSKVVYDIDFFCPRCGEKCEEVFAFKDSWFSYCCWAGRPVIVNSEQIKSQAEE